MKKPTSPKIKEKIHTISAGKPIDSALLKTFGWPQEKDAVLMAFRPALPLSALPVIRPPGNSLMRLGCFAPGVGLRYKGKAVPAMEIESRAPKSQAELRRVYRLTHQAYLKAWGPKLGGFYLTSMREFEKKFLPKTRSLIMFKKGKPVAFYSLLKYVREEKTDDLVAWHNPIGRLTAAERRSVWHQAASWFAKEAGHRLIVGLDYFDKDSIKGFSGLGFMVNRVRVATL